MNPDNSTSKSIATENVNDSLSNTEIQPFREKASDEFEYLKDRGADSFMQAEDLFLAFTADIINKKTVFTR